MEEKQARETLPARTGIWQWCLGEGREPRRSFTLMDLTCLFPKKSTSARGPGLADLQLPVWPGKGTPWRRLGFVLP